MTGADSLEHTSMWPGGIFLAVDHSKGVCASKSTKGRVPSASKGELLHVPKAVLASKGTCVLCLGSSKRGTVDLSKPFT